MGTPTLAVLAEAAAEAVVSTPWVGQLAQVAGGALTLVLVAVGGALWKRVNVLLGDLAVVRAQTENEHVDAKHPNLRDELTATRLAAERAVQVAGRAVELAENLAIAHTETRSDIGGLRADLRDTRADAREGREVAREGREVALTTDRRLTDHLQQADTDREALTDLAHLVTVRLASPTASDAA